MDKEAQEWIEAITGDKFPASESYEDVLKDGQVLCKLINILAPNSVAKINSSGGQFKFMENINNFQKALIAYGVPDIDVFQTVDLYEKKDISNVTNTIFAIGRAVSLSYLFTCIGRVLLIFVFNIFKRHTSTPSSRVPSWAPSPPMSASATSPRSS